MGPSPGSDDPAGSRLELLTDREPALLPREMWWLYLVAPLAASVLLVDGLFRQNWPHALRSIVGVYLPFFALASAFHLAYARVVPALLRPLARSWQRWSIHALVVATVAPAVALAILPLHQRFCERDASFVPFAAVCVVISAALVFPALIVQQLRVRALRVERHAMESRQAALRAQLQALQARTDPHFFFNTVNTVACLIPENPALAERTLERLADLFRYALESGNTPTVPLAREVEMLRDYLAIQTARFGPGLEISVELDPAVAQVPVPPLLLQPLVENAIVHGVARRMRGTIRVRAWREGDRVVVTVADDGPGPGASVHRGTQTSVRDLLARLSLLYPGRSSFDLAAAPGGGCLACVTLPADAATPA